MLNKLFAKTHLYQKILIGIMFLVLTGFTQLQDPITIYMIGDSTMSIKEKSAYPETGWGMPFAIFWDKTVTVDNHAQNGRSTKTFINEGLWKPVAAGMKKGDYLFIQFGHNDEVNTKASYATPDEFRSNLTRFVTEAKNREVNPVLITPVTRRNFDAAGKVVDTHVVYAQIVRDVAAKNNVPLIDLDSLSMQLLQTLGPDQSNLLFNHLLPGENPNYPEGKEDNTHFSELGARKMAELVLAHIRIIQPELAARIIKGKDLPIK